VLFADPELPVPVHRIAEDLLGLHVATAGLKALSGAPVFCRHQDMDSWLDRALEREANVFAAELVMPEPEVREVFARHGDATAVAAVFGVSPLAMQWRLYSFGLAGAPPVWEAAGTRVSRSPISGQRGRADTR
jgi:hypothetical protein